ncbi:hypothetical protein GCM10020260_04440 [Nesterenkonia halobia]|uniref:Uncharacterized protein n=1 Tax=Nesterenkonia halobia TaxID=37922 RepID=A0ABP6RBU8_9MICC
MEGEYALVEESLLLMGPSADIEISIHSNEDIAEPDTMGRKRWSIIPSLDTSSEDISDSN